MKIISWQSVLTDHQSHTMRALQKIMGTPLVIISGVRELDERKLQGWKSADTDDLDVRYLPQSGWWKKGLNILSQYPNAIHMFNSLWGDKRFFPLLIAAQMRGIRTVLMTEPYAEVGVGYLCESNAWVARCKAKLRPMLYRCAGLLVAKKFMAVFAISHKAEEQFINIGVPRDRVFPFGYYIPHVCISQTVEKSHNTRIRLIYVGSLIQRKGIHTLVKAMKLCKKNAVDIILDVYGPGDSSIFEKSNTIEYKGVIPFGEAQEVIAGYDVLVLPSLYDGWGVVVNEALLQGVPVIVSDQVGAKTLIEESGAGAVFPVDQAEALVSLLSELAGQRTVLDQWRKHAIDYRKMIEPEIAVKYLYDNLTNIYEGKPRHGS